MADSDVRAICNRGSIKSKLKLLESFVKTIRTSISEKPSLCEIQIRLEACSVLLKEIEKVQLLIEEKCDDDQLDSHFEERASFEARFHAIKSFLSELVSCELAKQSSNPFETAWKILCGKFYKKHFLIDSHFNSVISLPVVHKETSSKFASTLDCLSKQLTSLEGLKLTNDILYDSFIIHIVSEKLYKSTKREWKVFRQEKDLPKLLQFMNFLKDRLDILQSLDNEFLYKASPSNVKYLCKPPKSQLHLLVSKTLKCSYCKGHHKIILVQNLFSFPLIIESKRHNYYLLHKYTESAQASASESANMLLRPDALTSLDVEYSHMVLLSTIVCQIYDGQSSAYSGHFGITRWNIPENLNLADPSFEGPREIDLLLGANMFWDILLGEDDQQRKLWELEDINDSERLMSMEDIEGENLFQKDTFRTSTGQFVVKILFKHPPTLLDESKNTSIKLFIALERKFKDLKFKNLRKWNSNNCDVLSDFTNTDISHTTVTICDYNSCKILGIKWSIPRSAVANGSTLSDIHCFCDASTDAYAACICLLSIDPMGNYNVQLLCAKSKVAPLKTITVPRLELCAALLGSHFMGVVCNSLGTEVPTSMWSDSQVVLCWIHTEPNLLQVFVAIRVAKIQSLTESCSWMYIDFKQNPADLASREVLPEQLISSAKWWSRPQFLTNPRYNWPNTDFHLQYPNLPEVKKTSNIHTITSNDSVELFSRFSTLTKSNSVTAYCLRFLHNLRNKFDKRIGIIGPFELNVAKQLLVRLSQQKSIPNQLLLCQAENARDG
nr:unnamed protein product [Callosobruchus chinensis]